MVKKRMSDSHTGKAHQSRWQFGVVIGVLILVVVVLALKQTAPSATAPGDNGAQAETPTTAPGAEPQAQGGDTASLAPAVDELPQAHLERMLAEGQPIFAFFHSTTCYQCTEMTKIVEQVYPEFEGQVALVDVNVYDEANQSLLQQAGIRVIPTLVFFNRSGTPQGFTGVLPADELKAVLTNISSGDAQ